MRGRGLKQRFPGESQCSQGSPPMRGRGLKRELDRIIELGKSSPPMRGRGLKLEQAGACLEDSCRPPCGGVD